MTKPAVASTNDDAAAELGTTFKVTESGVVTAIRFYKGSANTGVHRGSLWSSDGRLLARVTFTDETSSGWQRAELSTGVPVQPGEKYVVSYLALNGGFAVEDGYFDKERVSGSIVGLADENGRYLSGANGGFPATGGSDASAYFVDVEIDFG